MTTSPDFSVAQVLAWARTKPADGPYSFHSNYGCALCQFLRETGRAVRPLVGGFDWEDAAVPAAGLQDIPEPLQRALIASTFGKLVERLEKLAPETIIPPSEWTRLDAYMADIETVSA